MLACMCLPTNIDFVRFSGGNKVLTLNLLIFQAFIQSMGTMGEVSTDYRDPEEDQWMEQQSSARLFERSRIKVLAGS